MKVHMITVIVVDHDGLGADQAGQEIENARYPNRCIYPHLWKTETRDCGEWSDSHPLNNTRTFDKAVAELFKS